ncbi:MAG: Hsp20/alpha crystallin family protein [Bacteroidetes bacterium]|nr:MAG: Hsp20/alpha crystallin family protein [Bacteroidota bacterium]
MLVRMNHPQQARTWTGLVNELFADFDQNRSKAFGAQQAVPVNIVETEDAFHMEIAAPGRHKEHFSLKVENDLLTIGYAIKSETADSSFKTVRKEFKTDDFSRSFSLNDKVNAEAIAAKYEDGLLKVLLPKKAAAKPEVKQISVQ